MAPAEQVRDSREQAARPCRRRGRDDFFDRARARLTLEVPPALIDPTAEGARGDLDLNPSMWERAGVRATKPAAVLVPVIDRSEPTVLLTIRTEDSPVMPGKSRFPAARSIRDDESRSPRPCARRRRRSGSRPPDRAARLSRPLSDVFRLPHSADRGAGQAGLCAHAQSARGRRDVRSAARFPDGAGQSSARSRDWKGISAGILRDTVRGSLHLGHHRGHREKPLRTGLRMIRPISTRSGCFSCRSCSMQPFCWRRGPGSCMPKSWSLPRIAGLIIASLVLMAGSFFVFAQFSGAPPGSTYVPAHVEGGKFVPGTTQ